MSIPPEQSALPPSIAGKNTSGNGGVMLTLKLKPARSAAVNLTEESLKQPPRASLLTNDKDASGNCHTGPQSAQYANRKEEKHKKRSVQAVSAPEVPEQKRTVLPNHPRLYLRLRTCPSCCPSSPCSPCAVEPASRHLPTALRTSAGVSAMDKLDIGGK
ncbi:hypothetical protein P171DRAFT_439239 [Karstenula rhodostoma CBS 690.94]|uniref:Uncharacterized protein n=1 Tax=Karstenula rhodostoma CBS 690.94 TaxID=1392251 RepID=A0A9P4UIT0_9PLEO|nr:hypothetical protein P171DRAFT_439239 [Karstenula rhodostoma CBS 690.94]